MKSKLLFNSSSYIEAINHELDLGPTKVYISSFGVNTGVSGRGSVYDRSPTHEILRWINVNTKNSRVVVGTPTHSVDTYIPRIVSNAEHFRGFTWRHSPNLHLKCWIFFRKRTITALVGGRNLGDSVWNDLSLWLPSSEVSNLVAYYEEVIWRAAIPVVIDKTTSIVFKGKEIK